MSRIGVRPPGVIGDQHALAVGESTITRKGLASAQTMGATGRLTLTFFTPQKTETVSQFRFISGGTAAGATPTLVRMGIYSVAPNGDGALIASIPNDTTLFSAPSTRYTRSFTAPFQKRAGQRYAAGFLVVTAATMPTVYGDSGFSAENAEPPRLTGYLPAQTDLPASFTDASLTAHNVLTYVVLLP